MDILDKVSNFENVFTNAAVKSERWRKWMVGEKKSYNQEDLNKDIETRNLVVDISGHYVFNEDIVIQEIKKMYANLERAGINPGQIVVNEIVKSIERYVDYFNLAGISSLVANPASK